MDQQLLRELACRLSERRSVILQKQPFFGRLLLHLGFGFAPCGTAYTDMKRIVFDPAFARKLKDSELEFILMHELMHCVLKHCTRGDGRLPMTYNVACDIVVNSVILEAMGQEEMLIDGSPAMHLAPDGNEGRLYSAEEVYQQLLKEQEKEGAGSFYSQPDSHKEWEELHGDRLVEAVWNKRILSAAKGAGYDRKLPIGVERLIEDLTYESMVDWRQVLQDFIRHDCYDYTFSVPDRRFSGEIVMPSFQEDTEKETVDELWFAVDTSGSVQDDALGEVLAELRAAVDQLGSLRGSISFFDHRVYPAIPFESAEDLSAIRPQGGGGTDFYEIFRYMQRHFEKTLPRAVIVMTDGYAEFPEEEMALGVPVIWLVTDRERRPPWGTCIHIKTV